MEFSEFCEFVFSNAKWCLYAFEGLFYFVFIFPNQFIYSALLCSFAPESIILSSILFVLCRIMLFDLHCKSKHFFSFGIKDFVTRLRKSWFHLRSRVGTNENIRRDGWISSVRLRTVARYS